MVATEPSTLRHVERPDPGGVIVGVDGSEGSQVALEWADRHARPVGPITAVACWHRPWWDLSSVVLGHDLPETAEVLEHRARTVAVSAAELVEDHSSATGRRERATLSVATGHGHPSDVLLELASEARLIVVGSRGRGHAAASVLGSTSARCAHNSNAPVAIVPGGVDPSEPIDHIAVGVDGSENSLSALRWALRFAPVGASIDVYFSWMTRSVASSLTAVELDRVRAASEVFLESVVDRLTREEQAWDRSVECHLSIGDPAAVLTAAGASMIVVGARSDGAFLSALLKSPANAVVHGPATVTVVVPPPA